MPALLLQLRPELPHGLPGPASGPEAEMPVEVPTLPGPPRQRQDAESGGLEQRAEENRQSPGEDQGKEPKVRVIINRVTLA